MSEPHSRLGLGLAAVGRPGYITSGRSSDLAADRTVAALQSRTSQLLDAAYTGGVRYVDAARSYGRAEVFLREWLDRRTDAADVMVGSKWGYHYTGEWRADAEVHEVKDHSLAAFRRQIGESQAILGTRLNLYHIHSVTADSPALDDGELLTALAQLRSSGVDVGVSVSGPKQAACIQRALGVRVDGVALFSSVQATWNPLERSAGGALADAAAQGVRVIVKEIHANGRLTPAADDDDDGARAFRRIADAAGIPVDQLAVASALAQPWVWRVLSGAATLDHIESHLQAAALEIPPDVLAETESVAEEPVTYWTTRAARPWS